MARRFFDEFEFELLEEFEFELLDELLLELLDEFELELLDEFWLELLDEFELELPAEATPAPRPRTAQAPSAAAEVLQVFAFLRGVADVSIVDLALVG